MRNKFWRLPEKTGYWLFFLLLGFALEGVALFYQYQLDYSPCVLCIHLRIWTAALILVAVLGLLVHKTRAGIILSQFLMLVVSAGMLERSWLLLGIERGFIEGSCSMDSGLPAWLALDKWFPAIFEVMEPCGYTPELLFGITMAEALLVFSVLMVFLHFMLFVSVLRANKNP